MVEGKNKYIDFLINEPYVLGHWLGFNDLITLNNEWIKKFILSEEDITILAHRGSYKTTCLSIAIAIIMVLFPNKNIIFLRKTDDDIVEVILQVAKILESEHIKHIVRKLYNCEISLPVSNNNEITTNLRTGVKGNTQLLGIGIKGSLTGKHADIVITDDIVNIKDRLSKAERDLTKQVYMELENVKNRGGRFINTGTPWHKEDAISIMPNIEKYDCYSTGLINKNKIEDLRKKMTSSLFAANYELKHIASEDALFVNPQFTDDLKIIHDGICHIDARYSGKDHTAFTILKQIDDKFYVYGKLYDKHVDDCIDDILRLKDKYLGGSIYCEDNGDKGYLARDLRKKGTVVNSYHESMNKFIKISSYLKRYWEDVVFLSTTDNNYLNEILDYTEEAEHDDAPDSLSSLIRTKVEKKEAKVFDKNMLLGR